MPERLLSLQPREIGTPEQRPLEAASLNLSLMEPGMANAGFLEAAALQLQALGLNHISFGIKDADPAVQRVANRLVPVERALVKQDR